MLATLVCLIAICVIAALVIWFGRSGCKCAELDLRVDELLSEGYINVGSDDLKPMTFRVIGLSQVNETLLEVCKGFDGYYSIRYDSNGQYIDSAFTKWDAPR